MRQGTPHHKAWIKKLPRSKMVFPKELTHRLKYLIWSLYSPIHPTIRDGAGALRIMKNRGRQPFCLGTIAPHLSIEEFVAHLTEHGYAYHRVAWEDDGEIVSLRLVKDFMYQYHVRIFEDRMVHGHYEYTPECYPLLHLWDVDREDRRGEFMALVGDRLIAHTSDDPSEYQWEFLSLLRYRSRRTRS